MASEEKHTGLRILNSVVKDNGKYLHIFKVDSVEFHVYLKPPLRS